MSDNAVSRAVMRQKRALKIMIMMLIKAYARQSAQIKQFQLSSNQVP